ncbi:MAG: leucyl aminopeptidase, partial [Chloroflexota bacterium]|nr:leucyl aminopeptidase [Chloroflexota bacterium]
MNLEVTSQPLASLDTDLLVVGIAQDESLPPTAQALDSEWSGLLGRVREDGAFKGKAYELEWLYPTPGPARRALLIGAGKVSAYDVR